MSKFILSLNRKLKKAIETGDKKMEQIVTKELINYRYDVYRRHYQQKKLTTSNRMVVGMLNKENFVSTYETIYQNLKSQVNAGLRKGVGNVYQYMVNQEAYGNKYNSIISLIREGAVREEAVQGMSYHEKIKFLATLSREEFAPPKGTYSKYINWDVVKEAYHQQLESGNSWKDSLKSIAQQYMGSE